MNHPREALKTPAISGRGSKSSENQDNNIRQIGLNDRLRASLVQLGRGANPHTRYEITVGKLPLPILAGIIALTLAVPFGTLYLIENTPGRIVPPTQVRNMKVPDVDGIIRQEIEAHNPLVPAAAKAVR